MAPKEPVQMHMYPHKHITKNNKSKSVLGGRGAEVMAQLLRTNQIQLTAFPKYPD